MKHVFQTDWLTLPFDTVLYVIKREDKLEIYTSSLAIALSNLVEAQDFTEQYNEYLLWKEPKELQSVTQEVKPIDPRDLVKDFDTFR